MQTLLSVILPTLDEERALPRALDRLSALAGPVEVIVADGGSSDGTVAVALEHPIVSRVVTSPPAPPGRAAQLNAAAAVARGDALVFLHADTILPPGAYRLVAGALEEPAVVGGNFALSFEGLDRFARLVGVVYGVLRRAGIYYGDSAVFVRGHVFRRLGGFRPLPIMDDYDFARRLERAGRTVCLPGPAVSSGRRWRALGPGRTLATWLTIQGLFVCGVPADRLARLYRVAR